MIFSRVTSHVNTFALVASVPSAPNISLPMADHNALLAGDELLGVQLNYQWRRVMVHLAENMLDRRIYDGTEIEIDAAIQQVHALLSDMYTLERTDVDYLGALVGLTSNLAFGTAGVDVGFTNDAIKPLHDVGGFWDSGNPKELKVPVGGAGYYFCFGHIRTGSALEGAVLRLYDGMFVQFGRAQMRVGQILTIHVNAALFFDEGDKLFLHAKTLAGTRTIQAGGDFFVGATLGMYRVGLVP